MIELLQKRTADGYVARVDLRLRPSPEVTPIALSVNAAISHYESSAMPWERAAFIRGRAAAGDTAFGQHFSYATPAVAWLECFVNTPPGVPITVSSGDDGYASPPNEIRVRSRSHSHTAPSTASRPRLSQTLRRISSDRFSPP